MASSLARRLQLNGWPQRRLRHHTTTDWNKTHILSSFPPEGINVSARNIYHTKIRHRGERKYWAFN